MSWGKARAAQPGKGSGALAVRREQISAWACQLRDAQGAGSAGGDPTVPARLETVWLAKAEVIYSSGAQPKACEWCGDKQQIHGAWAVPFPLRPTAPTDQPATGLPWAAAGARRGCMGTPLPPAWTETVRPRGIWHKDAVEGLSST